MNKKTAIDTPVKHTPGPWEVDKCGCLINDRKQLICHSFANCSEVEANQHLIAAAPDLLAACEKADACFSNLMKSVPWGKTYNVDFALLNESLIDLPFAIAKATGSELTPATNLSASV